MATIPGVLIFGGVNVQGGRSGNAPPAVVSLAEVLAGRAGAQFYSYDILRVTPDGTDGEPTASSLSWWPWFDQNLGTLYTVSAATATTVTVDPDPGWTTNEWAGSKVTTSSTALGFDNQAIAIVSNTSDTLTVASWTATPTLTGSLWINEGRFSDYAALTAYRTQGELASVSATRGGGAIAQAGVGLGWDVGLVRELWQNVYTDAPYFVCAKWASPSDASLYGSAGATRTSFETWLAKVNAAFALRYPSDTLQWSYVFLDHVYEDIDAWIAEYPATTKLLAYQTNLEAEIAWLRGATVLNNASCRFLLSDHSTAIRNVDEVAASGTSSWAWRQGVHATIAAADSNVRAIDFNGAELPTRGVSITVYDPDGDQEFYDQQVYWRDGAKLIAKSIELWEAGAATAADGVMPVYILIGDSMEVGRVTTAYTTALDSSVLTADARDARQRIWNRTNQAVEAYNAHVNSQTSGSTGSTAKAGPEFSLTAALMDRHPDTGFVIIKRASNGSALATEASAYDAEEDGGVWVDGTTGEHWDELAADVKNAYQAVNVQFGRQAELRGIFVGLGTNDASVADSGATFEAALDGFVGRLRHDYGTVVAGKQTPVIWRLPQLGVAGRIYDELVTIRAALRAKAAADPQFIAQDVDDLARETDDLHETPAASVTRGYRINDDLTTVALPNCAVD